MSDSPETFDINERPKLQSDTTNPSWQFPSIREKAHAAYLSPVPQNNWDATSIAVSGADLKIYDQLSRNPLVKAAYTLVHGGAFWTDGTIIAQNDYNLYPDFERTDRVIIDMINDQLSNLLYASFKDTSFDLLRTARSCGYACAEKVFDFINDECTLRAIKNKRPWNFNPYVDGYDNLVGIQHYITGKIFDPADFVFAPWPAIHVGVWFGEPDLECILHDIKMLERIEMAVAKGAELTSILPLIHHYTAGGTVTDEQVLNTLTTIDKMKSASIIHLPAAFDPERGELSELHKFEIPQDRANTEAMKYIIDFLDRLESRIMRALGIPDELGSTTVMHGSNAKAQTQLDMFVIKVNQCQDWHAKVVNTQIIPDIIRYNYDLPSQYRYPVYGLPEIKEDYLKDNADAFKTLIESGIVQPGEPWLRERLDIPPAPELGDTQTVSESAPGE